jgi:hypothetical protein
MSKRKKATCDDCYFRRAALCALTPDSPCPTFRAEMRGRITPPQQPQLVARPLDAAGVHAAA